MTTSRWKARCGAWVLAGALTLAGLAGGVACQGEDARQPDEVAQSTPQQVPSPAQSTPQEVPTEPHEPSEQPSGVQALDLHDLERQLRETDAIGFFTKLALKNDIDDLLSDLRDYHQEHDSVPAKLEKLHERFDLLVMKLLSLLQDREPELAGRIGRSRQALWQLLADPAQFAKLSP